MNRTTTACLLVALATSGGCRQITGLGDLTFDDQDGGPGGAGTTGDAGATGGAGGGGGAEPGDCVEGMAGECVEAAPEGWTLYGHIQRAAYTEAPTEPPPCPAGLVPQKLYAGPAGAAECAACACAWEGAQCSAPRVECYFDDPACGPPATYTKKATDVQCVSLPGAPDGTTSTACRLTSGADLLSPGDCTTSGGELINALPWKERITFCATPPVTGRCAEGQVCVPEAGAGYASGACIVREGAWTCPEGWGGTAIAAYTDVTDTRSCTPCACADAEATCAHDGGYAFFDMSGCSGEVAEIFDEGCADVSAIFDVQGGSVRPTLASVAPAACDGGSPAGSIEPAGPRTICCR